MAVACVPSTISLGPLPSSKWPTACSPSWEQTPTCEACATELAALQVPAAPESPATLLGLSRAELAVARLVAAGMTNKEVASELYVSVKTVEYHLRNSYIKLDITSRRALASLVN